jgi:hypothetical protein
MRSCGRAATCSRVTPAGSHSARSSSPWPKSTSVSLAMTAPRLSIHSATSLGNLPGNASTPRGSRSPAEYRCASLLAPPRSQATSGEPSSGWQPQPIRAAGAVYQSWDFGADLGGRVVECTTERALWLPYVEVSSVTATTNEALALGGSVMLAPREGPAGWRSIVSTPAGGEIAIWQVKR